MKEIALTRGMVALVDDADYETLAAHRWCVNESDGKFYAKRALPGDGGKRQVLMHKILLSVLPSFDVDHIDGNGLNNQRRNLRIATHRENTRNAGLRRNNTSGFKGVSLHKPSGRWQATIRDDTGRNRNLGSFQKREDAALAYDEAARRWHGAFARMNFPREGEMNAR